MARLVSSGFTGENQAPWAGDFFNRDHLMPGGAKLLASAFNPLGSVVVTVGTGGAAQAATSIPVEALSAALPSGTLLWFGAGEFARMTANAASGATSITVEALVAAVEEGDTMTVIGTGLKTVPSGTVIGRTLAERDAGTGFGPAVSADDEIFIVAFDVEDASVNNDVVLYRPGSVVRENYLPNWDDLDSTVQDEIRARYQCVLGSA